MSRGFDPRAADKLLEDALQRPGLRELMIAYEGARRAMDEYAAFRTATAAQTAEMASDSTAAQPA